MRSTPHHRHPEAVEGRSNFHPAQLCLNSPAYSPALTSTNDDITTPRMAETRDGVHFTDLGPLTGLNDPTTIAPTETRWIGSGSLVKLHGGRYAMFFAGGTCVDADSDAFHYVGWAESSDLKHWTVINGINNPIASTAPFTVIYRGKTVTVPAMPPVIGTTQGWFAGRIYAPLATTGRSGGSASRPRDQEADVDE